MAAPIYTPLPTAPARTMTPSAFALAADAFVAALALLQTEGDALGVFVEAQAAIAESAAQDLLTTFTDYSGDVDALTSNGVYKLATGATNGWTGAGDNDFLFNYYYDASNQVQTGYDSAGLVFVRSKVGGSWGAWDSGLRAATVAEIQSWSGAAVRADNLLTAALPQTLTDGANISFNMDSGWNAEVTLGGNRTLDNPTNQNVGTMGFLRVLQDGTGSRTLSFGTNYAFAGGSAPTLSTAASAVDVLFWAVTGSSEVLITKVLGIS